MNDILIEFGIMFFGWAGISFVCFRSWRKKGETL